MELHEEDKWEENPLVKAKRSKKRESLGLQTGRRLRRSKEQEVMNPLGLDVAEVDTVGSSTSSEGVEKRIKRPPRPPMHPRKSWVRSPPKPPDKRTIRRVNTAPVNRDPSKPVKTEATRSSALARVRNRSGGGGGGKWEAVKGTSPLQPGAALLRIREERPASVKRKRLKRRLYFLVAKGKAFTTGSRRLRWLLIGMLTLSILSLFVETLQQRVVSEEERSTLLVGCGVMEAVSGVIFLLDLLAQFYTCTVDKRLETQPLPGVCMSFVGMFGDRCRARPRVAYLMQFSTMFDIFTLLPTALWAFSGGTVTLLSMSSLDAWLRLVRIGRVTKALRYAPGLRLLTEVVTMQRSDLLTGFAMAMVCVTVMGIIIFTVENPTNGDEFSNMWMAWYFSAISLSTVGYGDLSPTTGLGKMVTVGLTLVMISLFTLPAGIVASGFTKLSQQRKLRIAEGLLFLDRTERRHQLRRALQTWGEWAHTLAEAETSEMDQTSVREDRDVQRRASMLSVLSEESSVTDAAARSILRAAAAFSGLARPTPHTGRLTASGTLRAAPAFNAALSTKFGLDPTVAKDTIQSNKRLAVAAEFIEACDNDDVTVMLELARVIGRPT